MRTNLQIPIFVLGVIFGSLVTSCADESSFRGKSSSDASSSDAKPSEGGSGADGDSSASGQQAGNPTTFAECKNAADSGVSDGNFTYRLLAQPMTFNSGRDACRQLGDQGDIIAEGQELPDEILACRKQIGKLWLRPANMNLFEPDVVGVEDPNNQNYIICFHK